VKNPSVYRQIAELHCSAIDQGFLAELGPAFLTLLYKALDQSPSSVLIVDVKGQVLRGFVSGGTGLGPVYRNLLKRLPDLILALWPVLFSYRKLRRIAELLLHTGKSMDTELPSAELYSIAVASEFRGAGVAEGLYKSLHNEFAARGIARFKIVVGETLAPAQAFYRKMGAAPAARIEVHSGARSTVFVDGQDDLHERAI
jgi:ribosomal protein S18 acetylase RimI-like enzyme